jgi:hypothetical protein
MLTKSRFTFVNIKHHLLSKIFIFTISLQYIHFFVETVQQNEILQRQDIPESEFLSNVHDNISLVIVDL